MIASKQRLNVMVVSLNMSKNSSGVAELCSISRWSGDRQNRRRRNLEGSCQTSSTCRTNALVTEHSRSLHIPFPDPVTYSAVLLQSCICSLHCCHDLGIFYLFFPSPVSPSIQVEQAATGNVRRDVSLSLSYYICVCL